MDVIRLFHKALSGDDIGTILGADAKISLYSELRHIDDLDDLLTNDMDYCIILHEDRPDRGHWSALSKYNGIHDHFDSYGNRPDKSLEWVNVQMRRRLNEATPYLTNLLRDKEYLYNNVKHQDRDGYVIFCGSHVVHSLYRLKNDGMDLHAYYEFMKSIKGEFAINYDIIVAEFFKKWL